MSAAAHRVTRQAARRLQQQPSVTSLPLDVQAHILSFVSGKSAARYGATGRTAQQAAKLSSDSRRKLQVASVTKAQRAAHDALVRNLLFKFKRHIYEFKISQPGNPLVWKVLGSNIDIDSQLVEDWEAMPGAGWGIEFIMSRPKTTLCEALVEVQRQPGGTVKLEVAYVSGRKCGTLGAAVREAVALYSKNPIRL